MITSHLEDLRDVIPQNQKSKMENLENVESRKVEMTAGEILTKVLCDYDNKKDEELKNKAMKAGMDFSKIDEWIARNPELSVGQLLQKARIKPEETFEILN